MAMTQDKREPVDHEMEALQLPDLDMSEGVHIQAVYWNHMQMQVALLQVRAWPVPTEHTRPLADYLEKCAMEYLVKHGIVENQVQDVKTAQVSTTRLQ
jgi:hypothetical protein